MYKIEELLKSNTYNGRGIIVGKSEDGKRIMTAYFIMGRSANSRNRVFVQEKNKLMIYPADAKKLEDPSLIIYPPVIIRKDCVIITNGDQTLTIDEFLSNNKSFEEALETRRFEPDAPNYTPRISAIVYKDGSYKMSILKAMDDKGTECARYIYNYKFVDGQGHFIHTYEKNGNPLPSFTGEPRKIKIINDTMDFAQNIWENLNKENKISLYVRSEEVETGEIKEILMNRFERVE